LLQYDGLIDPAFTALMWLGDDPERLAMLMEIRDGMTPGQRSRLNSPISAKQRVLQALKQRTGKDGKAKQARVNIDYTEQLAAKDSEIASLRERLAKSGESRFDLALDTTDDIAAVFVHSWTPYRVNQLADKLKAKLKKKGIKPAG
jgi:hypothetical protein